MSVLRDIAVFLVGFFMLRIVNAQLVFPGQCPNVQAMTNFNSARYLGKWYEAEAYFFLFEFGGKCITAQYSQKDNGMIGVVNKQISSLSGVEQEIKGEAEIVSRSDEAKLAVRFPSMPINIAAPYWVVETDYDNYSVVWSCYELGFVHARNAWILTRERNPPKSVIKKAYEIADSNGINRSYFLTTNQNNCPEDND